MNIDDLTIKQVRELVSLFAAQSVVLPQAQVCDNPAWEIGKIYLIRTVTMIDTGRLVAVTEHELVLEDAAWIADTGLFSSAIANAEFEEIEPFPDGRVIVGRGSVIDAIQIKTAPRSYK